MANDFITPSLIARTALATLFNNMVLAGLVSRDYDGDFAGKQGDTISVRKPAVFTAQTFNRASGITLQAVDEDSVALTLNTIADVSFPVTAEELTLKIDDFQERLINPAMDAIVEKVDKDVATQLIAAAAAGGGGGTITQGALTAHEAINLGRERLTRNKMPLTERYAVLSPEAATEALNDELFVSAEKAGTTDALRNANVGRAYGIDTYESGTLGYGSGTPGQTDALVFHRSAVILASRTLSTPRGVAGGQVAVENYKGLGLRVVQDYSITYKQDVVSVDFLYGLATARAAGSVNVNFGQGS